MWKRYVVSGKEKTLLYELLIFKKIIKSKKIDLKKYEGIAWGKNGMTGSNTMSSLNFIHKIKSYNIYGLIIEQWHENAEIKAKEFSEFLDMKYLGEINNTSIEKTYV